MDARDVDEMARQLQASEARFRQLFEDSPISLQIVGRDGRTLRVNRAWLALWGVPEEVLEPYVYATYNVFEDAYLQKLGVTDLIRRAFEGETFSLPPLLYDPAESGRPGEAGGDLPEVRARGLHPRVRRLRSRAVHRADHRRGAGRDRDRGQPGAGARRHADRRAAHRRAGEPQRLTAAAPRRDTVEMAARRLGEILMRAGALDEAQLRAALDEQKRFGGKLGAVLLRMKLVGEDTLVQALSHQFNCPAVRLDGRTVPPQVLELVSADFCRNHGVFPLAAEGKFLDVACTDPRELAVIDELRILTRRNVRAFLAGPLAIERAIQLHYRQRAAPDVDPQRVFMSGAQVMELEEEPSQAPPPPRASRPPPALRRGIDLDDAAGPFAPPGRAAVPPPGSPGRVATVPPPAQASPLEERVAQLEGIVVAMQRANHELLQRLAQLEALVMRDEGVLRQVLGLLIERGLCTREELMARISKPPP